MIALLAVGTIVEARQAKGIPRVGLLLPGTRSTYAIRIEAFQKGLRELGYGEGQNIATEWRFAEGRSDRLPSLGVELVRLNVDVIVTSTTPAAQAVLRATQKPPW
jgi:ABC-type uncharacterized transport system substrate-binding protein